MFKYATDNSNMQPIFAKAKHAYFSFKVSRLKKVCADLNHVQNINTEIKTGKIERKQNKRERKQRNNNIYTYIHKQ